ncbi:MAG: hypothetical protein IH989_02775, partial [Planctomycetes bacterium]|nr:hypothetical protein [Planctomycetota bacterium]
GNWSFGDYFKKEAIEWAWELLTEVWGIDKDRLHATYFEGNEAEGLEPDTEAAELWKTVTDIDPTHIHPGNKKDNFWEMGDVGPCGPCSEIHVDLTADKSGASLVNAGDPRVIELWNLVFIQFSRDAKGKLAPLPAKHVDTGLGFERLCGMLHAMQRGDIGRASNYDTDVFGPIFDAIRKRTGAPVYAGTLPKEGTKGQRDEGTEEGRDTGTEARGDAGDSLRPFVPSSLSPSQIMVDVSYRVIADHVRCLTFALTDGAVPDNSDIGSTLRNILRRAVRYGRQYMDMHEPFLCDLVEPLVDHMGDAFPELKSSAFYGNKNIARIAGIIRNEEESFFKTLDRGIEMLNGEIFHLLCKAVPRMDVDEIEIHDRDCNVSETNSFRPDSLGSAEVRRYRIVVQDPATFDLSALFESVPEISGATAFELHDTYGFPIDLTQIMASERGLKVDIAEYERLMDQARERARQKRNTAVVSELLDIPKEYLDKETDDQLKYASASIRAKFLYSVAMAVSGTDLWTHKGLLGLVFDRTCFYAEQGGQVGDRGVIQFSSAPDLAVKATLRSGSKVIHLVDPMPLVRSETPLKKGEDAQLIVDTENRRPTEQNHTSTHLLNWALREVLEFRGGGDKVNQRGSLVDPEKTRFDFSHNRPLTEDELSRIETLVQKQVDEKHRVYTTEVEKKSADEINTLRAVFGENYPDTVRVVSIGAPITEEDAQKTGASDWLLRSPKSSEWMKYSVEFCGGTHVKNTSEIGAFVLTHEEGVAKGVRRVVGISGEAARKAIELGKLLLVEASALAENEGDTGTKGRRDVGNSTVDLSAALSAFQQKVADATIPVLVRHELQARIVELQKLVKQQQKQSASASGEAVMDCVRKLFENAATIGGVKVVVGEVPSAPTDKLRGAIDWVRNKTEASAVLLAGVTGDRVTLIAGMSKAVVAKGVKAGDLIKEIAPLVGGKGGGRPDMAQGGGTDPSGVNAAIEHAVQWLAGRLG